MTQIFGVTLSLVHVWGPENLVRVLCVYYNGKLVGEEVKGVGVMKDEEVKFEEIESSHTRWT